MSLTRILFLCTGNSARSQMAEGWARALAPDGVELYSAGTHPGGVNPVAIRVMGEKQIDISGHRSKHLSEVPAEPDYVITLCAEADAECPTLPARKQRLAWHLDDPAKVGGSEEERLAAFRDARNLIEQRLREFFAGPEFSP